MKNKTVMMVAGEASGDLHGAEIARKLQAADPAIDCLGMGSHRMQAAGVELLVDSENIAVVGLIEVLKHWTDIKAALRTLERHIEKHPPDLLLLIDYQEFNLRLAQSAKALGVRVLFYVSPQVWAWREGRIRKFADRIDMMAVIFPFEVPYYEKAGIPVRYVGHPLTRRVRTGRDRGAARRHFGLDENRPLAALLPGSRRSEIKRILPILIETARLVRERNPQVQFLAAAANPHARQTIETMLDAHGVPMTVTDTDFYDAVGASDAAMVASGTATLEVALLQIPMTIVYRIAPLSYAILKRLIRIDNVGLANIVAGTPVAPEFIQGAAQPRAIAAEITRLLDDPAYREQTVSRLDIVRQRLGETDGLQGIADLTLEMLDR